MIETRSIRKTDSAGQFLDFICELIDEDAYLLINKKPTLEEEKKWLKEQLEAIKNKEQVTLTVWDGKKLIASCAARKGRWKDEQNISIGISVLKKYRRQGLGEKLLRETIKLADKKLKPRNIYLTVAAPNKPAISLYKKVGFKMFATFPKWLKQGRGYVDTLYMLLKK